MTKYSGPRLTIPLGRIEVHQVHKLPLGYRITCSIHSTSGDKVPFIINIPFDSADIRPADMLTLYTEVATHGKTS